MASSSLNFEDDFDLLLLAPAFIFSRFSRSSASRLVLLAVLLSSNSMAFQSAYFEEDLVLEGFVLEVNPVSPSMASLDFVRLGLLLLLPSSSKSEDLLRPSNTPPDFVRVGLDFERGLKVASRNSRSRDLALDFELLTETSSLSLLRGILQYIVE